MVTKCTDLASYMGHEGGGKENHFYSTHLSIFAYRKQSKPEAGKVLGMKRPPCCSNTRLTWTGHTILTGLCRPQSEEDQGLVTQGWLGLQGLFFMYHSLEYIIFTSCNLRLLHCVILYCNVGSAVHDVTMMYCKER